MKDEGDGVGQSDEERDEYRIAHGVAIFLRESSFFLHKHLLGGAGKRKSRGHKDPREHEKEKRSFLIRTVTVGRGIAPLRGHSPSQTILPIWNCTISQRNPMKFTIVIIRLSVAFVK